jgi:GNAT superfamily N-acetyltransferase
MGNLFVHPSYQRQGIGGKLMKDTENIVSKKYDYAKFYSYRNAVPLHKKRGCKMKNKKSLLMVKKL